MILSADERRRFEDEGFLVVRGAVAPGRVAQLLAALDGLVPESHYSEGGGGRPLEVAGISRGSAVIAEHAQSPLLGELCADALGARRVQLLQDTALIKAARDGGRVEWHQDFTYLGYLDQPRAVTLRLALTPCTRASGCMRVIAGSHRWGARSVEPGLSARAVEDALSTLPDELRAEVAGRERLVELEPGDVSLHHCLTFHCSGENRSGRARKTLITRVIDARCRLVPAGLPRPELLVHFPSEPDGRLSGERFPVLYDAALDG